MKSASAPGKGGEGNQQLRSDRQISDEILVSCKKIARERERDRSLLRIRNNNINNTQSQSDEWRAQAHTARVHMNLRGDDVTPLPIRGEDGTNSIPHQCSCLSQSCSG